MARTEPRQQAAPPEPRPEARSKPARPGVPLGIQSVEYDEEGKLFIAGQAESGTRLRAYLNDTHLSDATSAQGRFALSLKAQLPPGRYRVRVDEVEPHSGAVTARVEAAFEREPPAVLARVEAGGDASAGAGRPAAVEAGEPQVVMIRRGDNLWRIARRQYGRGVRYTNIYEANTDQIRDPHWVYPKQVFVLPLGQPPEAR